MYWFHRLTHVTALGIISSLSVSDIFRSNKWAGVTNFGEQYLSAAGDNDSRRIKLNVSIALGRKDVKSRNRKTGLEDEAGRIKN